MTSGVSQAVASPVLSAVEPQLYVADVKVSCDFYVGRLEFGVAFLYGDPPYYGQVFRDQVRLNLRLVCEAVFAGDVRRREDLLSATITLLRADEIEELFRGYQDAGIIFHQTLRTEPWGAETFVVSDPDENLILFAGPKAE